MYTSAPTGNQNTTETNTLGQNFNLHKLEHIVVFVSIKSARLGKAKEAGGQGKEEVHRLLCSRLSSFRLAAWFLAFAYGTPFQNFTQTTPKKWKKYGKLFRLPKTFKSRSEASFRSMENRLVIDTLDRV